MSFPGTPSVKCWIHPENTVFLGISRLLGESLGPRTLAISFALPHRFRSIPAQVFGRSDLHLATVAKSYSSTTVFGTRQRSLDENVLRSTSRFRIQMQRQSQWDIFYGTGHIAVRSLNSYGTFNSLAIVRATKASSCFCRFRSASTTLS